MERFSVPKCKECGSDLELQETLVPNYDDGGGLETVEIDYVVVGCDTCYYNYLDSQLANQGELPF